jgi:hypothetical protein
VSNAEPRQWRQAQHPYERADVTSNTYWDWVLSKGFLMAGAQAIAAEFVATFKEFPPRQKPQSFNLDQILAQMQKPNDD